MFSERCPNVNPLSPEPTALQPREKGGKKGKGGRERDDEKGLRRIEIAPLKVVDFNFTEREPSVTLRKLEPSKRLPTCAAHVCTCVEGYIVCIRFAYTHTGTHTMVRIAWKKAHVVVMNNVVENSLRLHGEPS